LWSCEEKKVTSLKKLARPSNRGGKKKKLLRGGAWPQKGRTVPNRHAGRPKGPEGREKPRTRQKG